jgi:tetratricopeptide (TPR) repeat protein
MISETAFIAAKRGCYGVVYRALDELKDVAELSPHPGIASLAFRSMGGVFSFCASCMDERSMSRLGAKMMEGYAALYDRTGRREAIVLAATVAEKLTNSNMFAAEEYDGILYLAGGIYRRQAEADDSEEHANKALALLFEALTARTAEASPVDHACIQGEIGRAYMALARVKNPVKGYRSAAAAFEDAGKILKISPWDSALYRGRAACAYTMLADEYCRGKRYDDALQAARSALALFPEAVKFFEKRSPEDLVEVSSGQGFAHTIVSEVYLRSRMFDLSLKHAALALDAYSLASRAIDIKTRPERYASMRANIGLTHVNMAEIHFREKRYENAITACDSAIAAYNEAIRIFDEHKKDKPAAETKKHLKKANDLFNTMMRIGVADRKPLAPVIGK